MLGCAEKVSPSVVVAVTLSSTGWTTFILVKLDQCGHLVSLLLLAQFIGVLSARGQGGTKEAASAEDQEPAHRQQHPRGSGDIGLH